MNTVNLLLGVLFSIVVLVSNPEKSKRTNEDVEHNASISSSCGENCQLPSEPDDDEDQD